MDIDPRLLPAFVVLAEELHFTKASQRLYIAQPALSQQIRRLEAQLGFELFDRTTRRVELTRAGELFLPGARRALDVIGEAVAEGRAVAAQDANELILSMGITGGVGLTAAIVAAFREANPGVVVRYVQADGLPAVQHDVADHRAHTAFAYEPIIREELAFAELTREPVWVGLPAPHPAAKLATVAPNDVHDLACIGPWSTLPRQIVDRWTGPFAAGRGEPPWGPETTALNDSLLGVSEGLGFFFVNEVFAELYPRPGIAYRPALGIEPVAFGVTWRPEADLPLVRSLLEISVKVASRG